MEEPDVKHNPNPRMRYEISLEVKDAPRQIDRIQGYVAFKVENDRCVPMTPLVGWLAPRWTEATTFKRISKSLYRAEVFADSLVDEDYYGLGICHWKLESAGAEISLGPINIASGIVGREVIDGSSSTRYFANGSRNDIRTELTDNGAPLREDYKSPSDTFSVTISSREAFPL